MSFKWGEIEEVIRNRKTFLEKNGFHLEDCVVMQVEHGEKIVIVDSSSKNTLTEFAISADALITKEKNLTLFLLTADCLPITLYDPKNEVIALAHLGWKPTDLKLIVKVIEELKNKFGSDPIELIAHIGPGIHKESYIFKNLTQKNSPEWLPFLEDIPSGETKIDLVGYNRAQMLAAGLLEDNIFIDSADTAISDEYYSHYRSVRMGEKEGRFATVLTLK